MVKVSKRVTAIVRNLGTVSRAPFEYFTRLPRLAFLGSDSGSQTPNVTCPFCQCDFECISSLASQSSGLVVKKEAAVAVPGHTIRYLVAHTRVVR